MYKVDKLGALVNPKVEELGGKIYYLEEVKALDLDVPKAYVLGKKIFEDYLEFNNIDFDEDKEKVFKFDEIKSKTYLGEFSKEQVIYLKKIFEELNKPIIVRSSGIQEDSSLTSCAGLFETKGQKYMILKDFLKQLNYVGFLHLIKS